jgi:hypothetical protein
MFDKSFNFLHKSKKSERLGGIDVKVHILTFSTSKKRRIIVHVHEHTDDSLYVLKFFDKSHRLSDSRFSLMTADGEASAVINTNIKILQYFYEKKPYASFAFMGSPTVEETEKNIKLSLHPAHDTKRFRLYRRIMSNFFNPVTFLHIQNLECSAYLIVNRDYIHPDDQNNLIKLISKLKLCYHNEIEVEGFH